MIIPFKKIHPLAKLPKRANQADAGADLYSVEDTQLEAFSWKAVPTGLVGAIPHGYVGLIHPRSGLALKKGLTVLNAPGTVDSGYRGEFLIILYNASKQKIFLEAGTRIAQLIIQEIQLADFQWRDQLDETDRSDGGFGSTGHK
ncbi:MAG: dUTP diphosphatase [Bifidobacteriaceae bacterium]|jgi:dUTP pyrophosphatase|nr:dUTP diphosphatase [Bifidobacteriaceae bacterium]